jgi:hypothetical protein
MLRPAPFRRLVWLVIAGFLIGALYSGVRHGTPAQGRVARRILNIP